MSSACDRVFEPLDLVSARTNCLPPPRSLVFTGVSYVLAGACDFALATTRAGEAGRFGGRQTYCRPEARSRAL